MTRFSIRQTKMKTHVNYYYHMLYFVRNRETESLKTIYSSAAAAAALRYGTVLEK